MRSILESLLLLIAGGALTALGGWVNDRRAEQRTRNEKREKAYLAWLNAQTSVMGRLTLLAEAAEQEPQSVQEHSRLMKQLGTIQEELLGLVSTLNSAAIYERDAKKRELVESLTQVYGLLTKHVVIILDHHETHLTWHALIADAEARLASLEESTARASLDNEGAGVPAEADERTLERARMTDIRDEAKSHVAACSTELAANAKTLSEQLKKIERDAPALRREITRLI